MSFYMNPNLYIVWITFCIIGVEVSQKTKYCNQIFLFRYEQRTKKTRVSEIQMLCYYQKWYDICFYYIRVNLRADQMYEEIRLFTSSLHTLINSKRESPQSIQNPKYRQYCFLGSDHQTRAKCQLLAGDEIKDSHRPNTKHTIFKLKHQRHRNVFI